MSDLDNLREDDGWDYIANFKIPPPITMRPINNNYFLYNMKTNEKLTDKPIVSYQVPVDESVPLDNPKDLPKYYVFVKYK